MTLGRPTDDADDAVLARLGYKQEFKRAFNPLEVFGVSFSIIGLLPSMASVLSNAISNGGSVSMVWGWAVGSCFILCIGIALAELASSAPTSGGLYYLTYTLSSPRSRNILCWIVGYANTIGMVTSIASIDWACAGQIGAAATIGSNGQFVMTDGQSYATYVAIIFSQAIICSMGTKALARLQILYVICNGLLCLIVIITLPIATPKELKNPASYVFGNFTNFSGWSNGLAFLLGLQSPLWTISGYDSVIHISEESYNAALSAPWGIISAIVVSGVLGWVINVILAFYMGPDLSSLINSPVGQPMAQIFLNSFGQKWTLVLWSFIIIIQYMMGSSMVLAASRQSFALARDGALPVSKLLYRINAHTGNPVNVVMFDCLLAVLIGLLGLAGSAAINAVFTISVTSLYVAYIVPIASRFLCENRYKPGPFSVGVLSGPVSTVAVIFMLFMLVILCFPTSPGPDAASMNYSSLVLGGVLLLAVGWYYMPIYGAVYWFQGPAFNVNSDRATPSHAPVGSVDEMTEKGLVGSKEDGLP